MSIESALNKKLPSRLPTRSRKVVELYLAGLPAGGIAEELGVPLSTVLSVMGQPEVIKAYTQVRLDLTSALKGEVGIAFKPSVIDKADRVSLLAEIAKCPGEKTSDRIAALGMLSKIAGDVVDLQKVEHSGTLDVRSLVVQIEDRAAESAARRAHEASKPPEPKQQATEAEFVMTDDGEVPNPLM